jgi:uncharacterized protein (TIGR03437 family)
LTGVAGSVTSADRSSQKPMPAVSATVGNIPAVAEYVGPSTGMLADGGRVKLRIPSNAPAGKSIPVVISFGSGNTQARVNLAIQ